MALPDTVANVISFADSSVSFSMVGTLLFKTLLIHDDCQQLAMPIYQTLSFLHLIIVRHYHQSTEYFGRSGILLRGWCLRMKTRYGMIGAQLMETTGLQYFHECIDEFEIPLQSLNISQQ